MKSRTQPRAAARPQEVRARKKSAPVVFAGPTTYRMTLNDGHKVERRANSAAEAVEWARREYRGFTVKECHSGMTKEEAALERDAAQYDPNRSKHAVAGLISHDIPPHEPYSESDTFTDTRRPKSDATVALFGDDVGVGGKLAD